MNSFPSPGHVGTNIAHSQFNQLLHGKRYDEEVLVYLNCILKYRLSVIKLTTQCVSFLNLQFPDALVFDTEAWQNDPGLKMAKNDNLTDAEPNPRRPADISWMQIYLTNLWVLKAFATLNPETTWLSRLWSHQ